MARLSTLLFLVLFFTGTAIAQDYPPMNSSEIRQNLEKLDVLGSVLYFAAHPDDENTRLLAWLAKEKKYRTGYLSLTRGDGGQNLIGNEQSEELGLIRTQELLDARRTDGAEQFFSRAFDFGFSKNPEETFAFWNREKILSDAVWVIRNFRPDVIICRFPEDGRGGHGNHTASAIIAQDAFKAAADPKRFPEQLKYVKTWQVKRLLWNTFNFGGNNTIEPGQFRVDVSQYNPLLGKSYGEIASESRSFHKSQGFGTAAQRGVSYEYFETIAGPAPKNDLMDGVDITWKRAGDKGKIVGEIGTALKTFDEKHPEKSVQALVQIYADIQQVSDEYWKKEKSEEVKKLIAAASGLFFEAVSQEREYAIGTPIPYQLNAIVRNPGGVKRVSFGGKNASAELKTNELSSASGTYQADKLTEPYWLSQTRGKGSFTVDSLRDIGSPENPDKPAVSVTFNIAGADIPFRIPVRYKYVDPVRGEVYEPVEVLPPVTINPSGSLLIFPDQQPKKIAVTLNSHSLFSGELTPVMPKGWRTDSARYSIRFTEKNQELVKTLTVYPPKEASKTSEQAWLGFVAGGDVNGKHYAEDRSLKYIRHDHIPLITWLPPATMKLVQADIKMAGKRIGYIEGAGDRVPELLKHIGYQVNVLSDAEISSGDLSKYDAIIAGVRTYNVKDNMPVLQPRLMEYVRQGGIYLVQYNVGGRDALSPMGPYPFTISRNRVTDELAKVTFDAKNAQLFSPNKISDKDFDGWIQERGLYFADGIDSHYATPLTMNDPGEPADKGSLLITNYGKGRYVYTSLAFFRELPAGVPGAIRLFVNLISQEKKE
ncbi:MAG: PIG-L family deacetylase [Mucilaginibacter polytrichastri]|nr:PIG-L family deacetylase [Mucilaginibacter polytrichastri]